MQNVQNEDVVEIDLQELFGLLLHWLWLIILCGIATGILGFAISYFVITPQYESTTKVYILNKQDSNTLTYSDVQLGTQLTKDYAQLIKSRTVLEQVIETCTLNESYEAFAGRVNVETLTDTRIIAITVTDPDPVMAQLLANEICKVASEHIKNVMDIQAVNVAEEANLPSAPSSPSIVKWTAIGLLLGVFLCALILIVRFLLDDTIKTSEDVERYLELSTLAMIPVIEEPQDKKKGRSRRSSHGETSERETEERDAESGWSSSDRDEDSDRHSDGEVRRSGKADRNTDRNIDRNADRNTDRSSEARRKGKVVQPVQSKKEEQEDELVIEELDAVVNGQEEK